MAQPQTIEVPVSIVLDLSESRRILRRILADAKSLNRELAVVEEQIAKQEAQLDVHFARIRTLGIRLEIDNG
jgi:uncharacterized membrane-anchored protein YhcB (DUF1043 family)